MTFTSADMLKGWIKNKSKETGAPANVLLQNYMMERFLERLSLSPYREHLILKGGFLIASMIGVDRRSTMDMDTTVKGLEISHDRLAAIVKEIISVGIEDGVDFIVQDIKNIRERSEYDDYRVSIVAKFHNIRVNMKLDFTTGDNIIPCEIEYEYKLMFENRAISILAYNLNTILAEKIETILSRSVTNTRARDFYDVYVLLSINKDNISMHELYHAVCEKAKERNSLTFILNQAKHLHDITVSPEIAKIWAAYTESYPYAKGVELENVISCIRWVFEGRE